MLVLFDLVASHLFVSQSFNGSFNLTLGELECLLRVSITDEHKVSASSVFYDCMLEIFMMPYPIDLDPIPIGDFYVIVGMN